MWVREHRDISKSAIQSVRCTASVSLLMEGKIASPEPFNVAAGYCR